MTRKEPPFTIGIEEEYLLVDRKTRDLAVNVPEALMVECQRRLEAQVSPEFLQSQIEVGTKVCATVKEARQDLARMRQCVAEVAGEHGLAPIAASTHPFAAWDRQKHTDKERYNAIARDMQAVARRLVICGMHVHVGLGDDEFIVFHNLASLILNGDAGDDIILVQAFALVGSQEDKERERTALRMSKMMWVTPMSP